MEKYEVTKYLKKKGFSFLRNGKKHEYWIRNGHIVVLSHGPAIEDRLFRKIKTDVRRGYPRRYCEVQGC